MNEPGADPNCHDNGCVGCVRTEREGGVPPYECAEPVRAQAVGRGLEFYVRILCTLREPCQCKHEAEDTV
jgi:hypothetical protein